MQYAGLNELLDSSSSSRHYFLSLPVSMQTSLHEQNDAIHSAAELHRQADVLEKHARAVGISEGFLY